MVCPSNVTVSCSFLNISRHITILVGSPSSIKNLSSTLFESNSLSLKTTYSWLLQLLLSIPTPYMGEPLSIEHPSDLTHALIMKLKHKWESKSTFFICVLLFCLSMFCDKFPSLRVSPKSIFSTTSSLELNPVFFHHTPRFLSSPMTLYLA
jgi:hypothetical protein